MAVVFAARASATSSVSADRRPGCSSAVRSTSAVRLRAGQVRLPAQDARRACARRGPTRRRRSRQPPRSPATASRARPAGADRGRTSHRPEPAAEAASDAMTDLRRRHRRRHDRGPQPGRVRRRSRRPSSSYREFTQHFPQPGLGRARRRPRSGRPCGRRCTTSSSRSARDDRRRHRDHQPARDRRRVGPLDRRAVRHGPSSGRTGARPARCDELAARRRTSTRPRSAPASSSTRTSRHEVRVAARARAASRSTTTSPSAPIDSWVIWNLTGGEVHATDATNASRTMLFDIRPLAWDDELCDLLARAPDALPDGRRRRAGGSASPSDRCGVPGGHPDQRHRRRPAGGPVRAGVLRRRAWPRTPTAPAASCC